MAIDGNVIAELKVVIENIIGIKKLPKGQLGADCCEKLCLMFERFNNDQQQFILKMLAEYQYINFSEYYSLCMQAAEKIDFGRYQKVSRISIVPCITKKDHDRGRYKSGIGMVNYFRSIDFNLLVNGKAKSTSAIKTNYYTSPFNYPKKPRKKDLLIFVDDFVGTGNTAVTAIEDFFAYSNRKKDNFCLTVFGSMEKGYNTLNQKKYPFYAVKMFKRGITDSTQFKNKSAAFTMMRTIEEELNSCPDYSMGYEKSEALVTMQRTPNNTFPVFWDSETKGGEEWPAPFPRHR